MHLTAHTRGVFTIAPTPFDESGAIDFKTLAKLCEFYEATEVDGITILGVMGEARKLEPDEAAKIITSSLPIPACRSSSVFPRRCGAWQSYRWRRGSRGYDRPDWESSH